jgi:hypothetical protein
VAAVWPDAGCPWCMRVLGLQPCLWPHLRLPRFPAQSVMRAWDAGSTLAAASSFTRRPAALHTGLYGPLRRELALCSPEISPRQQ